MESFTKKINPLPGLTSAQRQTTYQNQKHHLLLIFFADTTSLAILSIADIFLSSRI